MLCFFAMIEQQNGDTSSLSPARKASHLPPRQVAAFVGVFEIVIRHESLLVLTLQPFLINWCVSFSAAEGHLQTFNRSRRCDGKKNI